MMQDRRDTLILGPDDLACETLRTELLALADEAKVKAGAAFADGQEQHGALYLAASQWIVNKIGAPS